jgi:hypothetical protein
MERYEQNSDFVYENIMARRFQQTQFRFLGVMLSQNDASSIETIKSTCASHL